MVTVQLLVQLSLQTVQGSSYSPRSPRGRCGQRASARRRLSRSAPRWSVAPGKRGLQTPRENPAGPFPLRPYPVTWGTHPRSQVTWDARAAVRAGSRSGAPGSRPDRAPAPAPRAPASKGPFRCFCAASSRGWPFLLRTRDCLLPRRPRFSSWLLDAVAVTGVGSTLPESPWRPVSHDRDLGTSRAFSSGAANAGHRRPTGARSASRPAAACARPFRAPSTVRLLRRAHACLTFWELLDLGSGDTVFLLGDRLG